MALYILYISSIYVGMYVLLCTACAQQIMYAASNTLHTFLAVAFLRVRMHAARYYYSLLIYAYWAACTLSALYMCTDTHCYVRTCTILIKGYRFWHASYAKGSRWYGPRSGTTSLIWLHSFCEEFCNLRRINHHEKHTYRHAKWYM